ncbi:Ribonuclease H1 [Borealophlyctis nickersoniae]|nr:Ribonuclease H1 [Borealophlyctis nickersoniae]
MGRRRQRHREDICYKEHTYDSAPVLDRDFTYCSRSERFVTMRNCHVPIFFYADGACSQNGTFGARGGYGVYFGPNSPYNVSKPLQGPATNQRAELTAVIAAINVLLTEEDLQRSDSSGRPLWLKLLTDSAYVVNGLKSWLAKWKNNGWRTARGGPVQNRDLWEQLDESERRHGCVQVHHIARELNTEADRLARLGVAQPADIYADTDEDGFVLHIGPITDDVSSDDSYANTYEDGRVLHFRPITDDVSSDGLD